MAAMGLGPWIVLLAAPAAVCGMSVARSPYDLQKAERPESYRQLLRSYKDLQYYGNMTVGGQHLQVVMDTGSVDFVVLSKKCTQWCGDRVHFDAGESTTFLDGNLSLVLSYGSGTLLGREAYDTVGLGPLEADFTPFWEVYDASMPLLMRSGFEAIIGLGPMDIGSAVMAPGSPGNDLSFAVLFKKLGVENYSICLGAGPQADGYLTWNDQHVQDYPELFARLDVPVETGYWMVKMTDFRLGNVLIACETGCGAVLDSGTSLIAAPFEPFSELNSRAEDLITDCSNIAGLPDLHFKLDGVPFSLSPDSYIGKVHGKTSKDVSGHFRKSANESRSCQAALMHVSMDSAMGSVWILGMPFFRKYYSVFSQPTATSGSAIYTTLASEKCMPAVEQEQQLLAVHRGPAATARAQTARTIDASALHVPMWVSRAADAGPGHNLLSRARGLSRTAGRKVVRRAPSRLRHDTEESGAPALLVEQ